MITLLSFKKKYQEKEIISFDKLNFEKNGFYLIYGRSGCGKTTLLNCLALLDNYDGEYILDKNKVNDIDENKKALLRKEYISYIHQKPILLNDFTVFENIKVFCNLKEGTIFNHLSNFNLLDKKNQYVKYLSGGEKQRLSILKSIISNKPIILADEPTGALDKENAFFVINKLKELSKDHLVIVVSHDVKTFSEYADSIIKVNQKTISIEKKKYQNLCKTSLFSSNTNVAFKNLGKKYSNRIQKRKKVKNKLVQLFTSLSLLCVSLAMIMSFNVKDQIIDGFSQFYEPNQLVIRNKGAKQTLLKRNTVNDEEIEQILERIKVDQKRIFYSNNFESFFKDSNSLHLSLKYKTYQLQGFSARHFNEFIDINAANPQYFLKNDLKNDEICISIDNQLMLEMCYQLSIVKTFNSLFNFIKNNEVYLSLFVKNFDWGYEDEQLFRLVGFVVEPKQFVYHSNPLFAYEVFEKSMKLPSTIYDEVIERPWYLKREILINIDKSKRDLFIYDEYFSNYFIEKTTHEDLHFWYDKTTILNDGYYKIYKKNVADQIPFNKLRWLDDNNYNYEISNDLYLKNNIIQGFVNEIFLCSNLEKLAYIEDNFFKNEINGNIKIDENLNAVCGGILVDTKEPLKIKKTDKKTENKISISSKLYEKFKDEFKDSKLYLIALTNRISNNNSIIKEYVKSELVVEEIIESNENYIFGNKYFICSFMRDYLGLKYEKYAGTAVNLESSNKETDQIIRQYFHTFEVSKPFEEINIQIDSIIDILKIVLIIFAFILICISIFLLSLIIRSYILDLKEDLFVLYCNGLSKKEIGKIFKLYVFKIFLKSTIFSLIFNLGMSVMISFIVSESLNSLIKFRISYESILITFLISVIMTLAGFIFVNHFIKKQNIVISIRN